LHARLGLASLVIAEQGRTAYLPGVAQSLLRWFALLALILMPVGMGAAAAQPGASAQQMAHCEGMDTQQEHGEERSSDVPQAQLHCAACAALPAGQASGAFIAAAPSQQAVPAPANGSRGSGPETATPPPKLG
jgi:hypothetical protein